MTDNIPEAGFNAETVLPQVTGGERKAGSPKKETVEDIQREILTRATEVLQDDRCVTLTYPGNFSHEISTNPGYELGGQIRLGMLQAGRIGRDDICIALIHNTSTKNNISMGSRLNPQSDREIFIGRFTQTLPQRAQKSGRYFALGLSDTDRSLSGTFSEKMETYPQIAGGYPPFSDRWDNGSGQLLDMGSISGLGSAELFEEKDYSELLAAMRKGEFSVGLTKKVAKAEADLRLARSDQPLRVPLVNLPQGR